MDTVFRIFLKDLTTTPPVNPNDPLAGAMPDSSRYWGEGTRYVLGLGLKKWYDALCNPAAEPPEEGDPVAGDSMKTVIRGKGGAADVVDYPRSAYQSPRTMKPKAPYPKTPYTSADFWWDPTAANVTGTSLLLYCVRTPADSVVVKRDPAMVSKLGGTGTTHRTGRGTISELYVERMLTGGTIGQMQGLINVAFHETMHNKLTAGNEMHAQKGLAADTNFPGDTLTDANIRAMRAALDKPVIQDTQFL